MVQSTANAKDKILCPQSTDPFKDNFQSDTSLVEFLSSSKLSLWKKMAGQNNDTRQRNNICNADRKVDIATLYLARALGLTNFGIELVQLC